MELFDMLPYAGKRVCVALSGGRDSVALLHAFYKNAEHGGIALSALTCEHGLRGERSLADLAFCERLCGTWGVPLRVFRADVAALAAQTKTGVEEAGRNWRNACYARVLEEGDADMIATAHHRDDHAETVLFRLARGTSLAGLDAFGGRAGIVRPLLGVPRAAIDAYLAENGLAFTEDESNADERFTRNRLRHTVLPALEGAVPGAAEHLVQFAERAAEDEAFLAALARERVICGEHVLRVPLSLPAPLFSRACLFAMRACGIQKDYTAANIREAEKLKRLQSGRRVTLPQGVEAAREGEDAVFYLPAPACRAQAPFGVGTFAAPALEVGEGRRADALAADLDAFPDGCIVRTRREGDVFTPFGGSEKPLKKFLTDRKVPAREGRMLPLVAKGNVVYAVCGEEIADSVKVTQATRRIGYLYTPLRTPARRFQGE